MIELISPLPFIDSGGILHDGIIRTVPPICSICTEKSCLRGFQDRVVGKPRSCHKGAQYVYLEDVGGTAIVCIGFLVKGLKYPSNYKEILYKGIELDAGSFKKLIEDIGPQSRFSDQITDLQRRSQSKTLHDLKHLVNALERVVENNDVRLATELPHPTPNQIELLQSTVFGVYQILGAIKSQFELSDYLIAPETTDQEVRSIDIYRLFDKFAKMYQVLARPYNKTIEIVRPGYYLNIEREMKVVFTLLPSILLQNAIKYSREGSTIKLSISLEGNKAKVSVESFGPIVPDDVEPTIWLEGGQYNDPNEPKKPGSGLGLYLASRICSDCGFRISYTKRFTHYERNVALGFNTFIVQEK